MQDSALYKYLTPDIIGGLKKEEFGEEIRIRSRGKFRESHAETLINLARGSIGIREGAAGLSMDIGHILIQLELVNRLIAEIEHEMEITLNKVPFSSRLLSIKGLGVVTVGGIIGEVGDCKKFRTQSEIMKIAGLDLYEVSSGKWKGRSRGMKSMMALVAVSRKLLRILHAVVRDDGEYIVNYESVKRQVIKKAAYGIVTWAGRLSFSSIEALCDLPLQNT